MKHLILSFFLISSCYSIAIAQTDSLAVSTDSAKALVQKVKKEANIGLINYIPTGIRLGFDLVGLGVTAFDETRERYEFNADMDFNRFYLVADFGLQNTMLQKETFDYSHEGYFYRIGLDADFLKFDKDYNTLLFGIRYGQSTFNENLRINQVDSIFGTINRDLENRSVRSRWFELTGGLRVRMVGNLYTGFTFRIKLANSVIDSESAEFSPYDVPGFGLNQFNNRWSFNYYLVYKLQWRKKRLPIRLSP